MISGGAGFIGSHLVRGCLKQGDKVRVFDNFSTGKRENLVGCEVEIVEGDLRDAQSLERAVQDVEIIYHHAAFISVPLSLKEPQTCFAVNVEGTLNLFEAARKAKVQRIVIASSSAVYGDSQQLPLKESEHLLPLSPYGVSKQVTEVLASMYYRIYHLPIVALRYFNVYGPRQDPNSPYAAVSPRFIQHLRQGKSPVIFGDGTQVRDFVYVEDVVQANLLAARSTQADGLALNICSGKEVSILDVLHALYQIIAAEGISLPPPKFEAPRQGDIYRSVGDGWLAFQRLGFTPQIPLMEGLSRTVAAFFTG